jgi:hypothetical protein
MPENPAPPPPAQAESERLDAAADQAIAACGGDLRATIRALIVADEFLERELQTKVSQGCGFRFNPAGYSDVKPAGVPI